MSVVEEQAKELGVGAAGGVRGTSLWAEFAGISIMVRSRAPAVTALVYACLFIGVAQGKDAGKEACTTIRDEAACGASAEGVLHSFSRGCVIRKPKGTTDTGVTGRVWQGASGGASMGVGRPKVKMERGTQQKTAPGATRRICWTRCSRRR
jgi:hypothetical protein